MWPILDFPLLRQCNSMTFNTVSRENTTNDSGKKKPTKPYEMAKNEVKNLASPKLSIWQLVKCCDNVVCRLIEKSSPYSEELISCLEIRV